MIGSTFSTHLRASLLTLAVLLAAAVYKLARADFAPRNKVERALEIMGRTGLSDTEEDEMTAGYYEGLLDEAQQTARTSTGLLGNLSSLKPVPPDWQRTLAQTDAVRWRDDFLKYDMKPDADIPFKGDRLRTNRWGMRDKDYERQKPVGVRRIALVGSSISMGSGVGVDESFQALLEVRLNEAARCPGVRPYEILNFSVPGYMITQQMEMALTRAVTFEPDVIVLALNELAVGPQWSSHLATLVRRGVDLKYDFLKRIAAQADLRASDSGAKIATKLDPYKLDVIEGVIRTLYERSKSDGFSLVVLNVPFPAKRESLKRRIAEVHARLTDLDLPVIDALDAFDGRTLEELRVRDWDNHPNALGHRLIFESMKRRIESDARLRRIILGCDGEERQSP